jgi:hypothetical protein
MDFGGERTVALPIQAFQRVVANAMNESAMRTVQSDIAKRRQKLLLAFGSFATAEFSEVEAT